MFILPPNCIVPSATLLTMSPVFPSFLYLISLPLPLQTRIAIATANSPQVTSADPLNPGFGAQRHIYGHEDILIVFKHVTFQSASVWNTPIPQLHGDELLRLSR